MEFVSRFSIYHCQSFQRLDDFAIILLYQEEGAHRCHLAGYEPKCFLCKKLNN
jgi:hypothetical protein